MVDLATLALKVDSTDVVKGVGELDRLTAAGTKAEGATNNLAGSFNKASGAARDAENGWVRASSAAGALRMANDTATISAGRAGAALNAVTASAGAQRAGMQQLSYQIGDVAQQFALGVNPMTIFAQQGGQVVQALGLMKGGATGLVGFLAGPWGAAIMGAATIVGIFGASLLQSGSDAKKAGADWRDATTDADRLIASLKSLSALRKSGLSDQINDAQMRRNALTEQQMTLEIALAKKPKDARGTPMFSYKQLQDLQGIKQELAEVNSLVEIGTKELDRRSASEVKATVATRGHAAAVRGSASAHSYHAAAVSEDERALLSLTKLMEDSIPQIGANIINRGGLDEALKRNGIGTLDDDLAKIGDAADKAYAAAQQGMEDARAAADALNNALRDTVNLLDGLGGFGQTLGNIGAVILGLQTGDFSGARGPIGSLLGLLNQTAGGKDLIGSLTKVMDKVFGGDGSFAKTMTSVLQGAGVGMAAGQTVLGARSSNIGAAIGGAAGKAIGTAIAGPLGGAIGSILGGIAGGFIGGLFKKTKTGSASVTNSGTALGGNNADRRGASGSVGGSVQSSLANIVEALGGTGGSYGFTIGMRKDEYRVSGSAGANVTGKNPSGLIYRGKDAEEAARAALLNAIQDGAITGIRAGAQQLLRAGKDIESGLAKALKFQGVFDELKSKVDPVGFALGNITKEFDKLTAIFKEAGATAAEYADLEKLMGLKREEAMQTARQAVIDNLRDPITLQIRALELLGQQQDAIAGARQLELAGLKSTLRPLQSMVYQLEDARSIIERFGPLADDLRKFRTELVGNGSGTGFAAITAAFRSTAASAALGDADALGNLRGTATSFLDAAKENAGTALDYRRAVGEVLASVDKGIFAADSQVEYAQMQIDAIKNTNDILAQMRAEFAQLQEQVIVNTSTTARIMTRFEGDGITILPSSNTADFIRVRAV